MHEHARMGTMQRFATNMAIWLGRWAAFGLTLYLVSFYVLDSSAQKTLFYIAVGLPGLLLFFRLWPMFREHRAALSWLLVLLAYLSLSSLWGDRSELVEALKYSLYLLCLMIAIDAAYRSGVRQNHVITGLLVIGALAACAYWVSTLAHIERLGDLAGGRYSLYRLVGWGENNPINSAIVFGLTVLTAWWIFPAVGRVRQLILLVLILLCTGLMFVTKSRGPLLALTLTLGLVSLCRKRREDLLLWSVVAVAATVAVVSFDLGKIISDRASAPNYRLEIWSSSLDLFAEQPLWGQGFGKSAEIAIRPGVVVTHSHSTMLEFLRIGGGLGGLLCALVLWSSFRTLGSIRQADLFYLFWFIYGVACLSTNGRLPLSRPSIEWFAFWLPLLLSIFLPAQGIPDTQHRKD